MTETLKRCPECNGIYTRLHNSPKGFLHRCDDCGFQQGAVGRTEDEADVAWNTRAPDDVAKIVTWLRSDYFGCHSDWNVAHASEFAELIEGGDWKEKP